VRTLNCDFGDITRAGKFTYSPPCRPIDATFRWCGSRNLRRKAARALEFAGHQVGPTLPGAPRCANNEPNHLKAMVIRTHFAPNAVLSDCSNRILEQDEANCWKVNDGKTL